MVSAKVSDACYNYFHPLQYPDKTETSTAKKIGLTTLKVISYFTVAVPLIMLIVHARSTALAGRVYKFPILQEDRNANFQTAAKTSDAGGAILEQSRMQPVSPQLNPSIESKSPTKANQIKPPNQNPPAKTIHPKKVRGQALNFQIRLIFVRISGNFLFSTF